VRTHAPAETRIFPASSLFEDSGELRPSAGLAITDMRISKLRDDGPLSARKLRAWEMAVITGGSVVVTAAGVIVGYLVFKRCQEYEGSSGSGVNLVFISNE
jgi:hypothetical protein